MAKGWIGNLRFEDANYYIEWIDNKVLLYSIGNYIHYHYYSTMEKNMKRIYIYIYINIYRRN